MAKLTAAARKAIPGKSFALPGRRYPIENASHARNALSRVSQNGSPSEKATVRAKVHSKFPGIGKKSKSPGMSDMVSAFQAKRKAQMKGIKR